MIFFISTFLIGCVTCCGLMLLGELILSTFSFDNKAEAERYSKFFFALVVGIIIITIVQAFLSAGFRTLSILIILTLAYNVFSVRNRRKTFRNVIFRIKLKGEYFFLPVAAFLIFFLNFIYLFSITENSFKVPHEDLFFYAKISNAVNFYGNENLLFSSNGELFDYQKGVALYHFFESWFTTIFINFGIYNSYISLYFITVPVFVFTLYLGIVALWEQFGKITPLKLGLSLLLIFVCGITFEFYYSFVYMRNTIPGFTNTMPFSYYGRKLIIVYVFALVVANLFVSGKNHLAYQFLLLTAVVYSSGTFIGIFGGLVLVILLSIVFKRSTIFHIELRSKVFILLFILTFLAFSFYNKQDNFYDSFLPASLLDLSSPKKYPGMILSAASVVLYAALFFVFCYFLYFLVFLLNYRVVIAALKKLQKYLLVIALVIFVGCFGLFIFFTQLNARQFLTNLFPFVNVIAVVIMIVVIEQVFQTRRLAYSMSISILLICFVFYSNINTSFASQQYPVFNNLYSQEFRIMAREMLKPFDKNTLIGYHQSKPSERYNYPLFAKWVFLDFWGYTNLVELPKIIDGIRFSPAMAKAMLSAKSSQLVTGAKNSEFNFIDAAQLKIVVTDTVATFLPDNRIERMVCDSVSGECIYILKR